MLDTPAIIPRRSHGDKSMGLKLSELTLGPFVPIAESLPAMVWLGAPDGRCVYLNKAQREFWGLQISDVPAFTWASTLLDEDQPQLIETFNKAMAERAPFEVRARYRRFDGAVGVFDTPAAPRGAPNRQ